jgi:hypothetical protein
LARRFEDAVALLDLLAVEDRDLLPQDGFELLDG